MSQEEDRGSPAGAERALLEREGPEDASDEERGGGIGVGGEFAGAQDETKAPPSGGRRRSGANEEAVQQETVYCLKHCRSASARVFHERGNCCGSRRFEPILRSVAEAEGYSPCRRCVKAAPDHVGHYKHYESNVRKIVRETAAGTIQWVQEGPGVGRPLSVAQLQELASRIAGTPVARCVCVRLVCSC